MIHMKKLTDLKDLMVEQLRDIYHAEKDLNELLPKVIQQANDPDLKKILDDYLHDNEGQIMRLRQVFERLYFQKRGETCEAMKAMIMEAKDMMKRSANSAVMDAGIITALQHISHYEIAGYGAICTYANMMDDKNTSATIHKNLEEVKKMDRKLAKLAEEVINERAKSRVT